MSRNSMQLDRSELAMSRPYPERAEHDPGLHDRIARYLLNNLVKPAQGWLRDPTRALRPIVEQAAVHDRVLRIASDDELLQEARGLRATLRRQGFVPELVGRSFALVREAASRTIGHRHYDVQLMAGWGLLQGKLVEM